MIDTYLAIYYFENKNFEKAAVYADKVLEKNSKNLYANKILGLISYEKKEYLNAVKYFKNAIMFNADSSILPQFVESLQKSGFKEEAKKLLKNIQKD